MALEEGRCPLRAAMDGKGRGGRPACNGWKKGRVRRSSAADDDRVDPRRLRLPAMADPKDRFLGGA
jgi:hypothetical protein